MFLPWPPPAMRGEGERRHSDTGVRWVADHLPGLPAIHRLGLTFDLILLSGVWQHVALIEREGAMRKLVGLVRPGGVLALTLRHGPAEVERAIYPCRSRRWSVSPVTMMPWSPVSSRGRAGHGDGLVRASAGHGTPTREGD
jgi:hypothetical protein